MRDLKPGDRVRITGPWLTKGGGGQDYIGKLATVRKYWAGQIMPVEIEIDGMAMILFWRRENLRALPRRK